MYAIRSYYAICSTSSIAWSGSPRSSARYARTSSARSSWSRSPAESASGIILIAAALLALLLANSPLASAYFGFLDTDVQIRIASLDINKPLLLWINDGFMAIFFLLVGLEVKREMLDGSLSSREQALFPAIAALGGMLAPALVSYNFV